MQLPKPYNLVMPFKGHAFTVRILGHAEGEITAAAGPAGAPKQIGTTRLFTKRLDKESPATYCDVTCSQPRAMLEGLLRSGALVNRAVQFRVAGRGPTRRDTLHVTRIGASQ